MSDNFNGTLLCTISLDKSLKIFDVIKFDMINMTRLDYVSQAVSFVYTDHDPVRALAM
jgi:peptidylprolyl isomerase domain and WD repeat-containing protein 1